ncbi:lipoprotein [Xenorhabdus bovienii]|uniref:Lipoprotein n=1 Tax=Xenorhabdus bovienii str. kraussei Becker Underwood TaxID=1398204 RepID=A0A077PL11_XENBV|nr:lipoprotein [Xenorhabdus bovienii]CDH25085.1 conserved exported hypothetical protein [Xenorhabdus bovienii str. kraussei Becker Underwood]
MKKIALAAAAFFIVGCATTPVSNEAAKPVPEKQIIKHDLLIKKEGTGKVIIKRDSGFGGSACLSRIYVDGKELADLDPAQKIEVYPKVGRHIFSAHPKGICGGGMSEQEGRVVEDETLTYRIGYGSNGDYGIYPTAF